MKLKFMLTIASLLSILLMTVHLAEDIVYGMEKGGLSTLVAAVPILVIWLCGTAVPGDRRSGYVILLLGSLLGALVPVVHFMGAGGVTGGKIGTSGGALLFVWTLIALGVTSLFSIILSVLGLWKPQSVQSRQSNYSNVERPVAQRNGAAIRQADSGGAGRGARQGYHSPRSETGQCDARQNGRQGSGFRTGYV